MQALLGFFQNHFPILLAHKYVFMFIGGAIEGLNTMVLSGFLVSISSVLFWPSFLILTLGYTINGYMWYTVGYFAGAKPIDKWVRKDDKGKKIISKVEHYFEKYSGRAIILTKFTFSLTVATLIMSGSLKYNLKKFSLYNFIGSIGWVAITMGVGFFFGQSYKFFFRYILNFTYFIVFLAGAIVLVYLFKIFTRSAFVKSLLLNEKLQELRERFKKGIDGFLSE